MARRKGMMVGKGKKGYHNVTGKDPMVHGQSARGIKQPQRVRHIPAERGLIGEKSPILSARDISAQRKVELFYETKDWGNARIVLQKMNNREFIKSLSEMGSKYGIDPIRWYISSSLQVPKFNIRKSKLNDFNEVLDEFRKSEYRNNFIIRKNLGGFNKNELLYVIITLEGTGRDGYGQVLTFLR